MRKIVATTSVSLDGVMQAPGGPQEDPDYPLAGWAFPYWDETLDLTGRGFEGADREILLGRKTYEFFAEFWPTVPADNPNAASMNGARKYVASTTLTELSWENAELLTGNVLDAVRALKAQPGSDVQIVGSGDLIQTLQAASLIDEYIVWTFPVVLGRGRRLFEPGATPQALRLADTKASPAGVVMSTYTLVGDVPVGSFAP